jgi:hypothetical protein
MLGSGAQLYHERMFIPKKETILFKPVMSWLLQLHVKVEDHTSENDAHFNICKAKTGVRVSQKHKKW